MFYFSPDGKIQSAGIKKFENENLFLFQKRDFHVGGFTKPKNKKSVA